MIDSAGSGGESLHEGGLIVFSRSRLEIILQDWIRLASERGILLRDPSAILRNILGAEPSSEGADEEGGRIEPAKLMVGLGYLRRCILERWRFEVGTHLSIADLQDLEDRFDDIAIKALAGTEAQNVALAREDILAVVAHDLRNPLSTILLAASAISRSSDEGEAGARVRRQSELILRSAHQMDRFVSDLLDLSRPRQNGLLAVTKTSCEGTQLARNAVEVFAPVAAARRLQLLLEVGLESDAERLQLSCDADRVAQILSNLIGNATKFTPENGRIVVAVRRSSDDILFSVSDNGIGIASEQLPHIFEPYFQGYKGRAGLGLGLTVTRSLVRAHGGRIWVESIEGKGSTFFVALPADLETRCPAPKEDEESLH